MEKMGQENEEIRLLYFFDVVDDSGVDNGGFDAQNRRFIEGFLMNCTLECVAVFFVGDVRELLIFSVFC